MPFKAVFPGVTNDPKDLIADAALIPRDAGFAALTKLSAFYWSLHSALDARELGMLQPFFSKREMVKIVNHFRPPVGRVVTRNHILGAIWHILHYGSDRPDQLTDLQFETLGRLLLRVGGRIETENLVLEKSDDALLAAVFRLAGESAREAVEHLLSRYAGMYCGDYCEAQIERPSEAYDFQNDFQTVTGTESMIFQVLGYAMASVYAPDDESLTKLVLASPDKFFFVEAGFYVRSPYKSHLPKFFDLVRSSSSDLRAATTRAMGRSMQEMIDSMAGAIWQRPVVKMDGAAPSFPLDVWALLERFTTGPKWIVHDHYLKLLNADPMKGKGQWEAPRRKTLTFHGVAVEIYVGKLLRRFAELRGSVRVVRVENATGGCDYALYDERFPGMVLLIEVTSSSITRKALISGSLDSIKQEIHGVLLENGKMDQLQASYERLMANGIPGLEGVCRRFEKVIPMIVFERPWPMAEGVSRLYRRMGSKGVKHRKFLRRLEVFCLEDLEYALELLDRRRVGLGEVLRARARSDFLEWPLRDFIRSKYRIGHCRWIAHRWEILSQRAEEILGADDGQEVPVTIPPGSAGN